MERKSSLKDVEKKRMGGGKAPAALKGKIREGLKIHIRRWKKSISREKRGERGFIEKKGKKKKLLGGTILRGE